MGLSSSNTGEDFLTLDQTEFCNKALLLCMKYSASVTSWVRTPKRNAAVGGHPKSAHQLALGMDLVPDDLEDLSSMQKDAKRLGLWALSESNHLHIQGVAPDGN